MHKRPEHVIFYDRMFDFDVTNATSMQDCTGLIPFSPRDKYDIHSYDEIMNYSAEDADVTRQSKKHVQSL